MKLDLNLFSKTFLFFFTAVFLYSCDKDNIPQKQTTGINTGVEAVNNETSRLDKNLSSETIVTNLSITVIDDNNTPISNAIVKILNKEIKTNNYGFVLIEDITINKDFQAINVTANGYTPGIKTITPSTNGVSNITVTLLKPTFTKTFSAAEGGVVSNDNISIEFPKDAIADQNGDLYEGEVKTTVTYYNPNSENFVQSMPGTLVGLDDNDSLQALISKGMVKVDLTDSFNNELEIFENKEVTLRLPANNNSLSSIPLWHLNEEKGLWVQTGTAIKKDNEYIAKVSHFSTYNLDIPGETIDLTIILKDIDGNYLANQQAILKATNTNGSYIIKIETDNKGEVKIINAPKGANYTIELITSCENILSPIGNINETSVKEITVDSFYKPRNITLHGFLKGCNNEIMKNKAFSLILDNGNTKTHLNAYADNEGKYSLTKFLCNYNTSSTYNVEIRLYDGANDIVKNDQFIFDSDNIIRDITVCNGTIETANERIFEGNIIIDTDEKYQSFIKFGYTEVTGSLTLENLTNNDFNELSTLNKLYRLFIENNNNLKNLNGFENLTSINTLYIRNNTSLSNLNGLNNIKTTGSLSISNNPSLIDFKDLNNLTKVGGDFFIENNTKIQNFVGLENLTTIDARLFVENNHNLINFKGLDNLTSIANATHLQVFSVRENNSLINFKGLEKLTSFNYTLDIQGNNNLINFEGFNGLTKVNFLTIRYNNSLESFIGLNNLSEVSRSLKIEYNYNLKNLVGLENLKLTNEFKITKNYALTNLTGLNNLERTSSFLEIKENDNLINLVGLDKINSIGKLLIRNNKNFINFNGINNINSLSELNVYANNSLINFIGLENLIQIGDFYVIENEKLKSFKGLNNLNYINRDFWVKRNPSLINFIGLEKIDKLKFFWLNNNSNLLNFDGLENTNTISTIKFSDNPSIENLNSFKKLTAIGSIIIASNKKLINLCALQEPIIQDVNNYITYEVFDNAFNPTREDIRTGNCKQ
ncbi:MAG: hypothetical protein ACPGU6_03090 [Tenacibaculum sp.]